MNSYSGHIGKVETSGALSMATVILSGNVEITAIVIETPESAEYLKEGNPISVLFKETEVILSTGPIGKIGIQNRIPGEVRKVEAGSLLSKVALDTPLGKVEAIIASGELKSLGLTEGDQATALIKVNEVMLSAL
ncbi:MAG: TOBE domain-containing protein [Robiginitalea sp.]|jgi:molybdate transport system regulatory protein